MALALVVVVESFVGFEEHIGQSECTDTPAGSKELIKQEKRHSKKQEQRRSRKRKERETMQANKTQE